MAEEKTLTMNDIADILRDGLYALDITKLTAKQRDAREWAIMYCDDIENDDEVSE